MAKKYEATDTHIAAILFSTSEDKFRVPRYQRPYCWGDDHLSDFWEDIISEEGSILIGSFIFNNQYRKKEGYIDIIDGQQRLLTITILAAVLRDTLRELGENNLAKLIQRKHIAFEDIDGAQDYRIKLGDSAGKFFNLNLQNVSSDMVSAKAQSKEDKCIQASYLFLRDKITRKLSDITTKENKISYLKSIRDRYVNLQAIKISIENEDDAYEIFETTNARGMELSVVDLLKNQLFRKIPAKKDRDFAKEIWQEITSSIEQSGTDIRKFIRYFWISKYSFCSERKLFKEIKKEVTNWENFLNDLWDSSILYNKLLQGVDADFKEYKHSNNLFNSIYAIRLMGVTQCFSLLLSLLRNYKNLHTDPIKCVQLIENFSFSYSTICKKQANAVEKLYSKYAILIEKAANDKSLKKENKSKEIQRIIAEIKRKLLELKPKPETFYESFNDFSYVSSIKGRSLVKYLFARLNDDYYAETREHNINFEEVNTEHLLPQKPDKAWKLTKEKIKPYVNMAGNLTILDRKINSKAQNKLIKDKLVDYKKSALPLNKALVKDLESKTKPWNEKTIIDRIDERHKELAKLAYQVIGDFK